MWVAKRSNKPEFFLAVVFLLISYSTVLSQQLPKGFGYITDMCPTIKLDLRYKGTNNFIGKPIPGYKANKGIISKKALRALKKVQNELKKRQLGLLVYDAYRPQMAVDHFASWALELQDTVKKQQFYPDVKKSALFEKGYIAYKSGHSRGSTIDLTIIDLTTGKTLDMGSPYDFFGTISWTENPDISEMQKNNRKLLLDVMLKYGFSNYSKEWWHFTLKQEPFPDTYFNFPIQ